MFFKTILFVAVVQSVLSLKRIPPVPQTAARARFTINAADYGTLASISTINGINGYPYASVLTMSDGARGNGTGVAYLYITPLDQVSIDLSADPRCTLIVSLAQTDYCRKNKYDAMDPRCVRVHIVGQIVTINKNSAEYNGAYTTIVLRHPEVVNWPTNHQFYIAKINMKKIYVFDYFGGVKDVPVQEYLNARL